MKKLLLPAVAALALLAACNKDDDNTPTPQPTPASVNGFFRIAYDSTQVVIDSIRTYYLMANGTLDSNLIKGTYEWQSPARMYDNRDSGYAMAIAWGSARNSAVPIASIPAAPMRFSENFAPLTSSSFQNNSRINGQAVFKASYGFRMK